MNMFINILEILVMLVPILMAVAFVTMAESKIMGAMQRSCGPNAVGMWGLLQPFADALKLLVKEIIMPSQSNSLLFMIGPCITLMFALMGWSIMPFGEGLAMFDYELGVFFALAVSSMGSYGILMSGWAANSKYAFIGAISSTAQLLSYELVFSSIILMLMLFSGSFSMTYIVECQQAVWNMFPLLPIALAFFMAILAETNSPPFDLPEAESELVAGFMTEHGASMFVFFFLGEYSSLILMSAFMAMFFLGGHHCPDMQKLMMDPFFSMYNYYWSSDYTSYYQLLFDLTNQVMFVNLYNNNEIAQIQFWKWCSESVTLFSSKDIILSSISLLMDKFYGSYILGFKMIMVVFFYIWVSASFPSLSYDQLMSLCWKELLPLMFAYILFTICLFYAFDMMPYGINF